jgi:hypothetical protein
MAATIEQMQIYISELSILKAEEDSQEEKLKEIKEKKYELEKIILATLEENGLKSFKSDEFGEVNTRSRLSVRAPQGENKERFFQYLKEKGEFEALATIHSNTLNAWYKTEVERAASENKMFSAPGLDMPQTHTTIIYKKTKGK